MYAYIETGGKQMKVSAGQSIKVEKLEGDPGATVSFDKVVAVISDGSAIPVVAFEITGDVPYTVYDVSDRLRYHGWQVPAYTMPDNATDVAVLRIVVREGFTMDLGRAFIDHLQEACDDLQSNPPMKSATKQGFAH